MMRYLLYGLSGGVSAILSEVILYGLVSSSISEFLHTVEQQVDHWPEFLLVWSGAFVVGILAAQLRLSWLLLFIAIFLGQILGGVALLWVWILNGEYVSARGIVAVALTATSAITLLTLRYGAALLRKKTGEAR